MVALREEAAKVQASAAQSGEPAKAQELMAPLRQKAQRCKQQRAEKQAELDKINTDPKQLEEAAARSERQAVDLQDQLTRLRESELGGLERSHFDSRLLWQQHTSKLQEFRWQRDTAERTVAEVKRQLDERWRRWQPLWSSRVRRWHDRSVALGDAQTAGKQFSSLLSGNWDLLHEEQAARQAVLQSVAKLQEHIGRLTEQIVAIDDLR
eukprot:TRINITY_DN30477_c0_g2_i1.p1 TRINITY_DN30477_c0_g2~~TRINITY_DN30477_c0_g2_i1.p1  ORF type:complete len:217 (-),score=53.42 TRINITY_DN30477_c0_g2_i1:303-929(-)